MEYLNQLRSVLLPDEQRSSDALPPTPVDSTWSAWVDRTGELPPDFSQMPSLPFLPNPLIIDEGGADIPVETMAQGDIFSLARVRSYLDAERGW